MTDLIDGAEPDETDVLSESDGLNDNPTAEIEALHEGEEEQTASDPKPKKTAQDRINEVTAARREAERERDYWRNAALGGQQPQTQQRAAPVQPRDAAPNPDDFQYGDADPNYMVALAKHEAVAQVRQEFEAREQAQRLTVNQSTFNERVAQQYPAGEPEGIAALKALPAIRSEVTDLIFSSDKGPQLAEYLGDNPSALRRLEGLPAHMVGFELAKIEASFAAPPSPKRVTDAPSPAPKARGAGGQFSVSPDTTDFAAFERLAAKTAQ